MTWTETTSPTRPAASAPASTAARTAATSPRRVMATKPLPTLCCSTNCTLAAFSAASHASTAATIPLVSIRPIASAFAIAVSNSVEPRSHQEHEAVVENLERLLRAFVPSWFNSLSVCRQDCFRLPCDDEFFVRRDDPDFGVGLDAADFFFAAAHLVLMRVEDDAGPGEVVADRFAQCDAVLAD